MKPLSIIGGGIAGLSLGIALREQGLPVTLYEASSYPRHRVCGEFICGVQQQTLESLKVWRHLEDSERLKSTGWYHAGSMIYESQLPVEVYGVSRYRMDHRFAQHFQATGGTLLEGTRFTPTEDPAGQIWATGRASTEQDSSDWLGLKLHCSDIELSHDLEFHMGKHAYVGLSRIEGDKVNVCGLFRKQFGISAKKQNLPFAYMEACGLGALSERLQASNPDVNSILGVSNMSYSKKMKKEKRLILGDQNIMIPPFTGNGMSMAFESAETAIEPLVDYAQGKCAWEQAVGMVQERMAQRFQRRLRFAGLLHPAIHAPWGQASIIAFAKMRLIPFNLLFRSTH